MGASLSLIAFVLLLAVFKITSRKRASARFLTVALLILVLSLFFLLPNRETTLMVFAVALVPAAYFSVLAVWWQKRPPSPVRKRASLGSAVLSLFFLNFPFIFGAFLFLFRPPSLSSLFFAILTAGLALTLFYDFLNIPLALYHKHLEDTISKRNIRHYPSISIIVPAYNEENFIAGTIETLLELSYPKKEIIIVDDGSTDRTLEIAKSFVPRGVKVVHRPNGGKWAALNYGILFSKGEIILTVDADSLVSRTALIEVVKSFQDPEVTAVAGNVKVLNRNTLLTRCQALEYITDINIAKRPFDLFGSTMVVPGVFGAFRKKVLKGTGAYDPDTVTEDFDTTIKALKSGGVVQAISSAYAYTEAPETLIDFYNQRLRWYGGALQVMIKHRDILTHPIFGPLSTIGYPYILLSMIFVPFCGVVALISGIIACLTGTVLETLQMLALFIALEFLFSVLAIQLDDEDLTLALYSPFFVVGYRHLRDIIRFRSFLNVALGRKVAWTRARRLRRPPEMGRTS